MPEPHDGTGEPDDSRPGRRSSRTDDQRARARRRWFIVGVSSVATIPAAGAFSFVPGGGSDVVALVLTLMGSYTLPIALWRWHANSP